ncbi:prepilin-type N-terminal cleavage/methylation domain-containing protein [Gemmiger sp.]
MVHCNTKKRGSRGFTLVELMVVLAITAILAALVGGGLIAYIRLARFEKNEANARTLFQTAQIALTRKDTAGELDAFRQEVLHYGEAGDHFENDDEKDRRIYALYLDKNGDNTGSNKVVRDLLSNYIYDESLLNAAVCIEIDYESGQVYSVFYDTNSDKLRFDNEAGATNIYKRDFAYRRSESLVGYYSADGTVDVVELRQTKLKVKNPRLSNNETLTLSWGGDETRDMNVKYIAAAYRADTRTKLFEIEVELPTVKTDKPVELKTFLCDENGDPINQEGENYTFPLSYNKGNFVLTLDAMADANLLRSCENNPDAAKTGLYSITRLLQDAEPTDFYMTVQAQPKDNYVDAYTASKPIETNTENTLFAQGSTAQDATLKYFRHIYNLRWAESENWNLDDGATYTLTSQGLGANGLNWTGGSVTVYTAPETAGGPSVAQVPSQDNPVAWPTVPKLTDKMTLTSDTSLGGDTTVPLINLQFRGSSVAATGRGEGDTAENLKDRYIGLIGENDGTIEYITLRDVDLQVNVEAVKDGTRPETQPDDELWLTETTAVKAMQADGDDKNADYRDVHAVGALCGVSTGTLKNCTLIHGKNNAYTAQVLAALPFDNDSTVTSREAQKDTATVNQKTYTYYKNEPRGIGGLVGVAMPKEGAKLEKLTVGADVTVAGLLQDKATATVAKAAQNDTTAEQQRYQNAAAEPGTAAGNTSVWRSVGVGGVFGTLDAANMPADDPGVSNAAAVTGNGFVGGIAGNLYNSEPANPVTLTTLTNTGTITAGANYKGDTVGPHSLVLGQFFGGVAGYSKNVTLAACTSTTNSTLTDSRLTAAVQAGYTADGSLKDFSPLKGDFVGGLVGFGNNIALTDCKTEKGYVLGNRFVGGIAGGFTGSALKAAGGANSSAVFGNRYVGGIVSVNGQGSTVENMTNSGLVAGLGKNAAYVGGIAGLNDAAWGGTAASQVQATIQNCTNSMASDNATNTARITLLQNLSTYGKNKEAVYADYVGGLVGSNGKNAVLTWDNGYTAKTLSVGAILYGKNFVGGIAGYNDAAATIENNAPNKPLTVTGQVVAEGDAVGGMVGLNCAANLPAVTVRATKIQGVHCVGGVIGANMPVNGFAVNGRFVTNSSSGRVMADGLAGGIIGYNCLLQTAPTETDRTKWLPTVADGTGLVTGSSTVERSQNPITFADFTNTLNIEANAYVGGIVGYNDAETKLTISSATNGSETNPAAMGGLNMGYSAGALAGGVSLNQHENAGYDFENTHGYLAGGIIGYVAKDTKLIDCTNYGTVGHTCAAGGVAGWNDGTIENCTTTASIGSQQDAYRYLGGIAGVNGKGGTITASAPTGNVYVRGNYVIGGVAGINLSGAAINFEKSDSLTGTVQANKCAGGVAGVNCGTVTLGNNTVLNVTVTANEDYAGGIVGSNNSRGTTTAIVTGGQVKASVTAGKRYAGGAAGANYGTISGVIAANGTRVRANDTYAGGIAGVNDAKGLIDSCSNTATATGLNDYSVYAVNGGAGGIAGINNAGATISNAHVAGTGNNNTYGVNIGTANGTVGGIAETNAGTIKDSSLGKTTLVFTGASVGAAATYNNVGGVIDNVTLNNNAAISFRGGATAVGGLAGRNNGTVKNCKVNAGALDLSGLTANADTITFGGAVGVNEGVVDNAAREAKVENTTVALNVTNSDILNKMKNLGGVAGQNITTSQKVGDTVLTASGTLLKCTYSGTLGDGTVSSNGRITIGATAVSDTVGGIVGLNDGTVADSKVTAITLQVQGASGLSDSQTTAQKLENASHVGGIAGRNNGTIKTSYVATDANGKSSITARYGFVGGVAGSNNGRIEESGSASAFTETNGTTALVSQVGTWLSTKDANTGINEMVAELKSGSKYSNLKGVDTVTSAGYSNVYKREGSNVATGGTKAGLGENDLLVGLRGTTNADNKSGGYLGGIAGFNSVNGTMEKVATGKWFVYGDNTTTDSKVGGMIGMNEAKGDLKTLVNCAAVRRFIRVNNNDFRNRDDNDTTNTKNKDVAYVGGIIGVQQNTNDDQWVLSECVNYGSVFDSGSNYIGGVIASWLKNGGTIEKSFNFGTLSSNTNHGQAGSGTIGGIVGFFDKPTPGGTANIMSCQNHGDVLRRGTYYDNYKVIENVSGANDVAGILGKVEMASGSDYLRINIVDCVNGRVKIQAQTGAYGIMGWLGPWKSDNIARKVELYIDRCRNYATDVDVNPAGTTSGTAYTFFAGICGNRGNDGTQSNTSPTTITNCFALYKQGSTAKTAPIALNRSGNEKIVAYGNYFMDEEFSFNDTYIKGLKELKESSPQDYSKFADYSCKDNDKNYGKRLFAGINTSMDDGTAKFFAAGMDGQDVNDVDTKHCYITAVDRDNLRTIRRKIDGNERNSAVILLWYKDTEGSKKGPDSADITDELIQNYYSTVLEAKEPSNVASVNVTHDKSDTSVYGRYEITWPASTTSGVFKDNALQNVRYYLLTLYKYNDDGTQTPIGNYTNLVVYGTRYILEANEALDKAMGTSTQFRVGITAVTGAAKKSGETLSAPTNFLRPLPTPQLEVRLEKNDTYGQAYGQYLVLTNAEDYEGIDFEVEAYLLNDTGTVLTLTADKPEQSFRSGTGGTDGGGLGAATRLRAKAIPLDDSTSLYMDSAEYDEVIGIPKTYYNAQYTDERAGNPGLVHGKAFEPINAKDKGKPNITGTTTDDLKITVNLSFSPNTIPNTVPKYRVMLLAKYKGDATIADGVPLDGQYITLAAAEAPVYSNESAFVLTPPTEAFEGEYSDFQVISVPVTAGYSQVVTRWDLTADEAVKAIQAGGTEAAAWAQGLEIVRNTDGSYSYAHLTPLQFYAQDDPWGTKCQKWDFIKYQTRRDTGLLTNILPAPTVSSEAKGEVSAADNKLYYTFTWTQYESNGTTDTTKHNYDVTLYGMINDTAKEKIQLAADKSLTDDAHLQFNSTTGTYTLTVCVDDDLENKSTAWRYDRVSLHVTRVPDKGSTDIGAAGEAICSVMQRLPAVSGMGTINNLNDNDADALRYTINWPNGQGNVKSYSLYAEHKTADDKWEKLTDGWPVVVDATSATVDLERYQGETLRFYVVSNRYTTEQAGNPPTPEALGGFGSPDGGYSPEQVIDSRVAAPTVTEAVFTYTTPSQTQFLENEQLEMTVNDNAESYYYTGYLFTDYEAYKAVAAAAKAWQTATDTADKAAKLTALQNVLNAKLTDGTALRIIDDDKAAGGAPTADGTTISTTISLSANFAMRPEYARYWLLPALRSMEPDGSEQISSNWYYYVPDDYDSNKDNVMRLPAITLDAPKADTFATAGMTVTANLFGEGDIPWNPAEQSVDISRYAVEWAAVNFYDKEEPARNLANTYHAEIVSTYGTTDSYTITVAAQDVTDEDGTVTTARGDILSVTKTMTVDGVEKDVTLPADMAEDGHTYYDLTWTAKTDEDGNAVYDENGNLELESHPETLEGHCTVTGSDDKPRFKIEAFTMLEKIDMDGQPGYRITLPDLEDRLSADDTLQVFTSKVSVRAEGDPEKTVESDTLTLERQDTTAATFELLQGEMPVQTETVAESVSESAENATDDEETPYIATPETAAPKKPTEEDTLPAVG